MRVLAVIDSLAIGGAETQLGKVLGLLAAKGHSCLMCALKGRQEAEVSLKPGIRVLHLGKSSALTTPRTLWRLDQAFRAFRPTVAYSRLPFANACTRVISQRHGVKHVAGIDTMPELYSSAFGYPSLGLRLYRRIELRADRVVCNSQATADAVARLGSRPRHLAVVPNGIDTDEFRPAASSMPFVPFRLICISAFRREKGIPRLIRLLGDIAPQHPVHLTLVGDGEERSMVEALIARLKLQEHVSLLGYRRDTAALLQAAHVYVSPSFLEGFGIAVGEAAACGLPSIAFDVPGGLRHIVRPDTGVLVPEGRDDLFIESVVRLARDPTLVKNMGAAASVYVHDQLSLSRTLDKLEPLLMQWP